MDQTENTVDESLMSQQDEPIEIRSLKDLVDRINELSNVANTLLELRQEDMFRFLSKKSRNDLVQRLLEHSDEVLEASRASFRNLKRDKRVRVPDEVTDLMILGKRDAAVTIGQMSRTSEVEDGEE
jgi:hypothetical protein